jgi:hypothetical protein
MVHLYLREKSLPFTFLTYLSIIDPDKWFYNCCIMAVVPNPFLWLIQARIFIDRGPEKYVTGQQNEIQNMLQTDQWKGCGPRTYL